MKIKVWLSILMIFALAAESAQAGPRRKFRSRLLSGYRFGERVEHGSAPGFSLTTPFSTLIGSSLNGEVYDDHSLMQLRALRDRAQPWWDPYDTDPGEAQDAVNRALALQGSKTLLPMIKGSELGDEYKALERSFRSFMDNFKYSVQDTGAGYTVSNDTHGQKLVELNLRVNTSHGLDPQIILDDGFRLRYDWQEDVAIVEYVLPF